MSLTLTSQICMGSKQKDPKTHKSKILCFGWMQDIEKWFRRWDATHLLHDASLDSLVNEAFLQRQCIMRWDKLKAHASHIILHMLHLTTNPYSSRNGETIHIDTCQSPSPCLPFEPLLPCNIAHALRCETGRWATSDESGRLCTLCPKQVRESEYHTLIQCSTFDHI